MFSAAYKFNNDISRWEVTKTIDMTVSSTLPLCSLSHECIALIDLSHYLIFTPLSTHIIFRVCLRIHRFLINPCAIGN